MCWINGGKVPVAKVTGSETFAPESKKGWPFRSWERMFQGVKWPRSEWARERKGQELNWPQSERARERIGQGPIGQVAPGSKLARERKGCESSNTAKL